MELNKVIDLEALTASGFPEGLIEQASGFMAQKLVLPEHV